MKYLPILCLLFAGCIGPAWEEYQDDIDQALQDLEAGKISKAEFNAIREAEAKELQENVKEEIAEQTKGPITGNPLADSVIGLIGMGLTSMYGVNAMRDRRRRKRKEPVTVPD